jgi:hypothetical protein
MGRYGNNIKIEFNKTGCDWIQLAEDRIQC